MCHACYPNAFDYKEYCGWLVVDRQTDRQTVPVCLIDPRGRIQVQNSSNIKCKVHKYTSLHTHSANTTIRGELMPTFEFLTCCCHRVHEERLSMCRYYCQSVSAQTSGRAVGVYWQKQFPLVLQRTSRWNKRVILKQ